MVESEFTAIIILFWRIPGQYHAVKSSFRGVYRDRLAKIQLEENKVLTTKHSRLAIPKG